MRKFFFSISHFLCLYILSLFFSSPSLLAQEVSLSPLANTPLHGNYCVAASGVSLHEAPHTDSFTLSVPGDPIRAYWTWTGRSLAAPNIGDDRIRIAHNGQPAVEIAAQNSADSPFSVRTWHSYIYTDTALSLVQPLTNTYSISDLAINGLSLENHGVGLLVIYESPSCPYQRIEVRWGLDSFHHSRSGPHGPDSDNQCTTFASDNTPRELGTHVILGGVAGQDRGNLLWALTGSGFVPPSIAPDVGNQPYPGAEAVVVRQTSTITQTFTESPGPEWDVFSKKLPLQPTDTFACLQIESPADEDGISGIWALAAFELPIEPPAITLDKGPNLQTVVAGSPVSFTLRIENTGPTELTNVSVTDALVPACNRLFPALSPGAVETYECAIAGATQTFTNTAVVTALPPASRAISATDTASVVALNPGLTIEKGPDNQTIIAGDMVTFTLTITNSGDVPLNNVSVSDAQAPNCSRDLGTLVPGEVETILCARNDVATSFVNTAIATGITPLGEGIQAQDSATVDVITPALTVQKLPGDQLIVRGNPVTFTVQVQNSGDVTLTEIVTVDPISPQCDRQIGNLAPAEQFTYQCSVADVLFDFTNVITATGTTPLGTAVFDSNSAQVDVLGPQIELTKSPNEQTIRVGGSAQFTITVQNIGDVTLNTVTVTDTLAPNCSTSFAQIRAGESETYVCTVADVQGDFINTAQVSAFSPSGERVADDDSASVTAVTAILDVQKTPDFQTVLLGESATFTISVQNIGDAAFDDVYVSNIIITDTKTPQCNATIGRLESGETFQYICSQPTVIKDFTNVAEVGGQPSVGDPVSDQDWAHVQVINPAISLTKSPDVQTIPVNASAEFSFQVENTGSVTLTQVVVEDPLVPSCSANLGTLSPGEVRNYRCTDEAIQSSYTNEASVTGQPEAGPLVSDSDAAAVDVVRPALSITKLPDFQDVALGGTAIFTITVENVGDVVLFDTVVIDGLSPDCNRTIGDLGPGSRQSYTCIQPDVRSDFINLAEATARPAIGDLADDSAQATVNLLTPAIELEKEAVEQNIQLGATAEFTITVTNSGDTPLEAVTVTDQQAPECNREIGRLSAGSSQSYRCSMPNIVESTVNVAVVQAQPPVGPLVTTIAEAAVSVPPAELRVTKDDREALTQPGGVVQYFISYANQGAGTATDVVITEIVPQFSEFVPSASSPEWVCENNDFSEGSVCQYRLGNLAPGDSDTDPIVFTVSITERLPESVDVILNSVAIDGRNNSVTGSSNLDDESTPIIGLSLNVIDEPITPSSRHLQNRVFVPYMAHNLGLYIAD